jgi:hypothetical protein
MARSSLTYIPGLSSTKPKIFNNFTSKTTLIWGIELQAEFLNNKQQEI